MVQLMLEGLGGDRRAGGKGAFGIECYHVNVRLSKKLEDIGDLRIGKFLLLLGYCLQTIWCRFRYRVTTLYYIPAPGKPSALYRDWVVMALCRPFFKRLVLHWHAAGLAKWLETHCQIRARTLTYLLSKQVDLSIVLSRYNRADAEKLFSRRIKVVSNGIPDPCPDFTQEVLPRRQARFAARKKLWSGAALEPEELRATGGDPGVVQVLYLAHCTAEKGLFDTIAGVVAANRLLEQRQSPVSLRLLVTGLFVRDDERREFDRWMAQPGLSELVHYLGFVTGAQKDQIMRHADLFCFPTYYQNENQPVNLIEAMAFGLPILTTRWRSLPELFPPDYAGLVDIRSPEQIGRAILTLLETESGAGFRAIFQSRFTLAQYLAGLSEALQALEKEAPTGAPAPAPAGTT